MFCYYVKTYVVFLINQLSKLIVCLTYGLDNKIVLFLKTGINGYHGYRTAPGAVNSQGDSFAEGAITGISQNLSDTCTLISPSKACVHVKALLGPRCSYKFFKFLLRQ